LNRFVGLALDIFRSGAHGQDRTADLPLTKGVLYH
jgi:hypothetical protein